MLTRTGPGLRSIPSAPFGYNAQWVGKRQREAYLPRAGADVVER
jgi:hypothetical protein